MIWSIYYNYYQIYICMKVARFIGLIRAMWVSSHNNTCIQVCEIYQLAVHSKVFYIMALFLIIMQNHLSAKSLVSKITYQQNHLSAKSLVSKITYHANSHIMQNHLSAKSLVSKITYHAKSLFIQNHLSAKSLISKIIYQQNHLSSVTGCDQYRYLNIQRALLS